MRVILLFVILFNICFFSIQSKAQKADTAFIPILRMPRDTAIAINLINKGWIISSDNPKLAGAIADQVMPKSNQYCLKKLEAEALLLKAKSYDYLGDYKKGLSLNFKALIVSHFLNSPILKAKSYRQIGGMYQALGNTKQALYFLSKSYLISINANYIKGMGAALNDLGLIYKHESNYNKALELFFKSIEYKKMVGDIKNMATSYSHIGEIYGKLNDYERAIDFHIKSLKLRLQINDLWGISQSYASIGVIKYYTNDYSSAFNFMHRSLLLCQRLSYKLGLAEQLNNIGEVYQKQGDFVNSFKYYKASLKVHLEIGSPAGLADVYFNLFILNKILHNNDTALFYLKKGLALDCLLKNKDGIIEDFIGLSNFYKEIGNINLALKYLDDANFALKSHSSIKYMCDIEEIKSQLYEKQHNYKASLESYKKYVLLRDSVLNQNKKVAVALKEAKYEFDKKALADSLKNSEKQKAQALQIKYKNSELKQQKIKQNALLIGIVLMFALGWLLYSRYKAVSLQRISERKLLLFEKEQALVEERTRIADEMHDDVGADLSNLLLKIRMNERTQTSSQAVDLGGLKSTTNGIIYKIDEIIWSLNAQRDSLNELVNFIVKYYDTILKEHQLIGQAEIPDLVLQFPISAKTRRNIFLTVKEILNNALKHAKATEIKLKITFESDLLEIAISDNGKGFDVEKAHNGNGLRTMQKRLDQTKGNISIQSNAASGTAIKLTIPLA